MEKTITESGVIIQVTTDIDNLLCEKNKLKNFIQIIDDELESRRNAKSVLVWKMALEEIGGKKKTLPELMTTPQLSVRTTAAALLLNAVHLLQADVS